MSDIFVSYARADFERVKLLAEILARRGWSVWWDQAILAGKPFDEIIEKALSKAYCAIVLWTRASVQSQWVRAEAGEGLRRGILIPILFEDIEIPLVFRQLQTAVMLDWHGEISHPGFKRLE